MPGHKRQQSQNPDGTWDYKCICGHSKRNLKNKGTVSIVFKSHIQSATNPSSLISYKDN